MKYLIAFATSLALLAATPALTKTTPKAKHPPTEQVAPAVPEGCLPADAVLADIHSKTPIVNAGMATPAMVPQLVQLAGLDAAKNYDLVVVLQHAGNKFGLVFGYVLDGEHSVFCVAGMVPEQAMPKFLAILNGETVDKGGI